MSIFRYITFIGLCLLIACSIEQGGSNSSSGTKLLSVENATIRVPEALKLRASAGSHRFLDNDSNENSMDLPHEYRIEIWPDQHSDCPLLGVSKEFEMSNGGMWGAVDYPFDYSETELNPDCRPYRPLAASYAFCAEKDGKAVVICVQQMTDNPELAEQIFATFRWME